MASLEQIRKALAATVSGNTSFELYTYDKVSDLVETPAVIVEPEKIDFEGAFGRGMYKHTLRLYVVASRGVSGEYGQSLLDKMIDFRDDGIPKIIFEHPDIGLTDGTDAQVIAMFGYGGEFQQNKIPHVGAILRVEVITDPRA